MAWKIVVAGGGFGGLFTVRTLERLLPAQGAQITLVNDTNFMLYTPLLPGAGAGTLEPRHVVVPLREQLSKADLHLGAVVGLDSEKRRLSVESLGGVAELEYDRLVLALGSVSRTFPIPGLRENALGFKTLADAIALRNKVIQSLEAAEISENPAEQRAYLSFVFVGAGYAGLEGLAELQDFAADVIELYPRCRVHGMRWLLVEAQPRVMGEISESLADFATGELRRRGIEIHTSTQVESVSADGVLLSTGEFVPTKTVAWTAGVSPNPVIGKFDLPLDERSGRLEVDRYLNVRGSDNIWALGDCAAVPDPRDLEQPCPPTAQHAMREGKIAARNIAATLGSGKKRKFRYKSLGVFVGMGHYQAVASTAGIKWRGLPAWFLARTYHLAMMPSLGRKLRLVVDWTVGLMFGRDSSELGQLGHPPELSD